MSAPSLLWPLPGGFSKVSSPFGTRIHPVTKKQVSHSGIDIPCPQGTTIYAPADGVIASVWHDTAFGGGLSMTIRIGHFRVGFAHLSAANVTRGAKVKKGAPVALSGGTPGTYGAGTSTGPHLHLTFRDLISGKLMDPDKVAWIGREVSDG